MVSTGETTGGDIGFGQVGTFLVLFVGLLVLGTGAATGGRGCTGIVLFLLIILVGLVVVRIATGIDGGCTGTFAEVGLETCVASCVASCAASCVASCARVAHLDVGVVVAIGGRKGCRHCEWVW